MRIKALTGGTFALLLSGCSSADAQLSSPPVPTKAEAAGDFVLVDKSDRLLVVMKRGKEVARFTDIKFGDAPVGHKQFEGDEKTPEGRYVIDARNPGSRYHLSLHINYPNAADRAFAARHGKPPGGDIFIHGQPNGSPVKRLPHDWTDGCIALSNTEIRKLWGMIADGTEIEIRE